MRSSQATAYEIHLYLGHGHLEKVYENALTHRLRKVGMQVKQQYPLNVYDEGWNAALVNIALIS